MTLHEYAAAWMRGNQDGGWRPRTARIHAAALRKLAPLLGQETLATLSRASCLSALQTLRRQSSPATTAMVLSTLRTLCNTAVDDGCLPSNPTHGLARRLTLQRPRTGTKAMDATQVSRFCEAAQGRPFYFLLFTLLLKTGLRLGEALALRWEDVTADGIRVRHTLGPAYELGPTKSGRERLVRIPESLRALLEAHRPRHRDHGCADWFVFARDHRGLKPISPRTAQEQMARVCDAAGIPRYTPHCLRHTYASTLLSKGESIQYVQRQLGHASVRLTVDVYGSWLPVQRITQEE